MSDQELLSIVNRCFRYEDGKLYWKEKTSANATAIKIGSEAGYDNSGGYLIVKIMYKNYLVHRLIYLMHYNQIPETIDHIDGNTINNKISNLRPCSITENCQNQKTAKNNASGIKNISKNTGSSTWKAEITVNGVKKYLGSFQTKELAGLAAKRARKLYFGEFARDY